MQMWDITEIYLRVLRSPSFEDKCAEVCWFLRQPWSAKECYGGLVGWVMPRESYSHHVINKLSVYKSYKCAIYKTVQGKKSSTTFARFNWIVEKPEFLNSIFYFQFTFPECVCVGIPELQFMNYCKYLYNQYWSYSYRFTFGFLLVPRLYALLLWSINFGCYA